MKRWIFAVFSVILIAFSANATVNDGHVTTTVGYVTHELDTRQDEFPAQSGTKAMTFGDDAGEIGAREVKSNLGSSTSDDSLPTVSAVNDGLDDKQDAVAANNTNTVLTYTGTAGNIGAKGIYQNSGTYASQMDSLVTAGTFNTALRNGLESEFVCAETDPSNGQCWAWSINNNGGPWNYFYMDDIPEGSWNNGMHTIVRNADGTLTLTTTSSNGAISTRKKLSELAPGLEIGKTYKFSITTTTVTQRIILYKSTGDYIVWLDGDTKTITADMLDRTVYIYATAYGSSTISDIKITAVDSSTPVGASGTILPAGYTPLEYIEANSAGPRILLGLSGDLSFYIVAQSNRIKGGVQILLGISTAVGNWFGENNHSFWGAGHISGTYVNVAPTTKIAGTVTFDSNGVHGTLNGESFSRSVSNQSRSSWYLFGVNSSSYLYLFQGKVWELKAYRNNTLVGDFVPARRNSDGEIGMYDIVRNTFLTNVGTGSFTAGPDANNNLYLPQNQ